MSPPETALPPRVRVHAVDVLRGLAMVLMVIDHVRVYSGVPAGGPTAALFLTRWVTHFCAPAFVFLAGASAYLGRRSSKQLALRGAWLVLLELTVMRLGWTFNLDFGHYALAGVLWVIGLSMIALALLRLLPAPVVGGLGVAIALGHALLGRHEGTLWSLLHEGLAEGPVPTFAGGPELFVLYSLVPWVGVMAAGYGFGAILSAPGPRRDRICLELGTAACAAFVILRALGLYGDPRSFHELATHMPAWIAFLNTSKYPASPHFLLMTLGPLLLALPLAERARGHVGRWLALFGRVPLFFYVLHIPLVHALALAVSLVREGHVNAWLLANHPVAAPPAPDGYRWSLTLLYGVWLVALALLWPACRAYARARVTSP